MEPKAQPTLTLNSMRRRGDLGPSHVVVRGWLGIQLSPFWSIIPCIQTMLVWLLRINHNLV